ncbi:MAG: 3'(2'),5'-bisphosphate nucleotidase [bacterium]|nr:3'(2'),5'-bisphosphate nucleotidase [bacterium]
MTAPDPTRPWSAHPLARELDVALDAVREAGSLCHEVGQAVDRGALAKPDRSPVTVADFGAQALVCRALGEAFAADPVMGEESAAALRQPEGAALLARVTALVAARQPGAGAGDVCEWIDRGQLAAAAPRFWALDPVDGTKGFLRGGQYAIALALVIDGQLAAAVMGCPSLGTQVADDAGDGTLFAALASGGAWQMPLRAAGAPRIMRTSTVADPARMRFCESVEAAHSSHGNAARVTELLGVTAPPVRLDSQAKYGVVARGEAEAYLRMPNRADYSENIWDHAAGALVVTEAGGTVTDIAGKPLDFSRGVKLAVNRGVVATCGPVHAAVIGAIGKLGLAG